MVTFSLGRAKTRSTVLILFLCFCNCALGQTCGDGTCKTTNPNPEHISNLSSYCAKDCAMPVCGDGVCVTSPYTGFTAENFANCAKDCGVPVCGDLVCSANPMNGTAETITNCPKDCSCGDGYCDIDFESCFWCDDCSCSFDGFRVRVWENKARNIDLKAATAVSSPSHISSNTTIAYPANYINRPGSLFVVMDSYLQVNVTQSYTFQIVAKNVGVTMKIDSHAVLNMPLQAEGKSTARVVLQKEYIHLIQVEVQSISNLTKSVALQWKTSDTAEFKEFTESFYSYNVCGDHIFDQRAEATCLTDNKLNKTFNAASDVCGDGLCLERFPETCFMDCYTEITKICSPIAVPPGHISAGLPVRDDTFGSLIRNQMLWHLPGIEHMSYGFDIVRGEQSLYPMFYFGYCDDKSFSTVQDTYRGNVYTVPQELYAQPLPKCTFSVDSQTFSSAAKLAESMSQEISVDVSLSGGVDVGLVSGKASLAFSGSRAVKSAQELETKSSGAVIKSTIQCATSQVKVNQYNFHPTFLEAVAKAKNLADIQKIIRKYGSHVYSSAVLGGKLEQLTTTSKTFRSSKTQREIEEHASLSLSASVSGPAYSGSGSFSGSVDSATSGESQSTYEKSTFRSSVMTYGGPPGSFGPTTSDAPSNFGDWASSVDLLPVPINYTLIPIYDALPNTWTVKFSNGTEVNVRKAFIEAQRTEFISLDGTRLTEEPRPVKYTMYWFWDGAHKSESYTWTTKFILRIIDSSGGWWDREIIDQQPGRGGQWNFNSVHLPLRFDFHFSRNLTISEIEIVTSGVGQRTVGPIGNRDVYRNGERWGEVFLHNWSTGRGWWADNREWDSCAQVQSGGCEASDRIHKWDIQEDSPSNYQLGLELVRTGSVWPLGEGVFEITFVGANETLRDTVKWKNGIVGLDSGTMAIKMYYLSRPKIGEIKKIFIRLSALSLTTEENAQFYGVRNVWLQVPNCNVASFDQSCSTSKDWLVKHSHPDKEYTLSTYNASPVEIYLNTLPYYDM